MGREVASVEGREEGEVSSETGKWVTVWRDVHGWHVYETDHEELVVEMEESLREDESVTHAKAFYAPDYEIRREED